jgi:hypothetical protein
MGFQDVPQLFNVSPNMFPIALTLSDIFALSFTLVIYRTLEEN